MNKVLSARLRRCTAGIGPASDSDIEAAVDALSAARPHALAGDDPASRIAGHLPPVLARLSKLAECESAYADGMHEMAAAVAHVRFLMREASKEGRDITVVELTAILDRNKHAGGAT